MARQALGVEHYAQEGFEGAAQTAAIIDSGWNLSHPAFVDADCVTRVKGVLSALEADGEDAAWFTAAARGVDNYEVGVHGMPIAGTLAGDGRMITRCRQAWRDAKGAASYGDSVYRVGMAPAASLLLVDKGDDQVSESFFGVGDAWQKPATLGASPAGLPDVINYSAGVRETCLIDGGDKLKGASHIEATGWTDAGLAFRDYFHADVLVVKSAGSMDFSYDRFRGEPACDDLLYASGPCAPWVLSVGSLFVENGPAQGIQRSTTLGRASGGDRLPDGRSWPSLVVGPSKACGALTAEKVTCHGDDGCELDEGSRVLLAARVDQQPVYGDMSATSGAAPKVAGAALVFREWVQTSAFPAVADSAGCMMVNLLNMADRYNNTASLRPQPRWGLGRFRLRWYGPQEREAAPTPPKDTSKDAGLDLPELTGRRYHQSCWHTQRATLGAEATLLIDITGEHVEVPDDVRRLDALVWWDEPNTLFPDDKAHVTLTLQRRRRGLTWRTVDWSDNDSGEGQEHVVSLTFDNFDPDGRKPCIEGGRLRLVLQTGEVPGAITSVAREDRGDVQTVTCLRGEPERTFYIACFWSTGPEPSDIHCEDPPVAHCPTGVTNHDLP